MFPNLDYEFRKRHQLFEFGDQKWLPKFSRDGIRTFLNTSHRVMKYYKPWSKILAQTLNKTGQREIVVLGGGGILLCQLLQMELRTQYKMKVKFYLTDLYPIQEQNKFLNIDDDIVCVKEPVNMLNVPSNYKGLRLIAVAFHHLNPKQAQAVLRDSFENKASICIFEYTKNSLIGVISSLFYPLFNLLISLFTYPFQFSILIFSWVIPYFPLLLSIDGLMSNLRTYNKRELLEMTQSLSSDDYEWNVIDQNAPLHPTLLTTLVGCSKKIENNNTF